MQNLKQQLIQASNNGDFLEVAYQAYLQANGDRHSVGRCIALLHNDGCIDAIVEFRKLFKKPGTNFSSIEYIFEDALPELNAPVPKVMDCVKHLVNEAGHHGAYLAVKKFFDADSHRAIEALTIIELNDDMIDFTVSVIQSGSSFDLERFTDITIRLAEDFSKPDLQKRAIFALGKIDYQSNNKLINETFKTIERLTVIETLDANVKRNMLLSSVELYKHDDTLENRFLDIIKSISTNKDDIILDTFAELLWMNNQYLHNDIIDELLDNLTDVNVENKGTIEKIDYALNDLINLNKAEKVIHFLECFIKDSIKITIFKSTTRELYNSNHQLLCKLITRWLLSPNLSLRAAILVIMEQGIDEEKEITVDLAELLPYQDAQPFLFLTRKVIGWLYSKPISATSFIISLLEKAPENEANKMKQLLYYPLLCSYPGKVKAYLEQYNKSSSKKIKNIIKEALYRLDEYHEGLNISPSIPELLPSSEAREIYARYWSKKMNKSFKEARENSITAALFPQSVLLYGRQFVIHVPQIDGSIKRFQSELNSIGTTIEIPALLTIDLIGFEYMLTMFRLERINNETDN